MYKYDPTLFISIHAPTRGATADVVDFATVDAISIHAPTRGATISPYPQPYPTSISIHAPTRGATVILMEDGFGKKFQSTLPRGERPLLLFLSNYKIIISIHAPTRGATLALAVLGDTVTISIHAPTRGATPFPLVYPLYKIFQSTLPRGERQISSSTCNKF